LCYKNTISIFSGNFAINFDFSRQIFEEFRFFRQLHKKISIFAGNLKKIQFQEFQFLGNLKKIDFLGKFQFFTGNFAQKIDFSRHISKKFQIVSGNITKKFDF